MIPPSSRARLAAVSAGVSWRPRFSIAAAWIRLGPVPSDLLARPADVSTVVVDRQARRCTKRARTPERVRRGSMRATFRPALVNATLAAEDHRFFRHPGIDPGSRREPWSATFAPALSSRVARRSPNRPRRSCSTGGLADRGSRGLVSKFREAVLAMRLEHRLTKRQILALYLNVAPYGNQVVGAGRASEVYFGVQPSLLTVAQATFLAALPQRPSAYNPYKDPRPALRRQRRIIDTLVHQKLISPDEAHTARNERLRIEPAARAFAAPHFVEMVMAAQGASEAGASDDNARRHTAGDGRRHRPRASGIAAAARCAQRRGRRARQRHV